MPPSKEYNVTKYACYMSSSGMAAVFPLLGVILLLFMKRRFNKAKQGKEY